MLLKRSTALASLLSYQPYRQVIVTLLLPFLSTFTHADNHKDLTYIVGTNQGIYKTIIEKTKNELKKNRQRPYSSNIIDFSRKEGPAQQGKKIITIGSKAAQYAYKHYPNTPIISALLTQSSFNTLAQESYGDTATAIQQRVTPIFLDQPFSRYISLGRSLINDAKSVGILIGPTNLKNIPAMKKHLDNLGLKSVFAIINTKDNPIKSIDPAIRDTDFFVVLPDQQLINRTAAKLILQLSYRHKKPIIAYSYKYVRAGALAAVFSSPNDVSKSISETINLQKDNKPITSYTPDLFSIELNKSVAHSLGIQLSPLKTYMENINHSEETLK